ncbi:SLC13 family permease [bacterium]|nr:MAG: SLC13 family permease [bacterium]
MIIALVTEKIDATIAMFGALMILLMTGIINAKEAFGGFSNHGMLSIAFLYVIAYAVQSTGLLDGWGRFLLGKKAGNIRWTLTRFLIPVACMSAIMNNTPIVGLFIPMVKTWSRKTGIPASKILIPLSYATILGGTLTLIGTSTTLVVHGLLIDNGFDGFGFFETSKIGIGYAIVGLFFIILIAPSLLPNRKETLTELGESTREFVVVLKISEYYEGLGKSIEDAGLRNLQGLFLFQISRNGKVIAPVGPTDILELGDRLFFTGLPSTIVELQKQPGLDIINDSNMDLKQFDSMKSKLFEVVISNGSRLVGKKVRESDFRGQFNAVILAIHRHGQRIDKKIGDIEFQEGDTLLILSQRGFAKRWYHSKEFLLVSESEELLSRPPKTTVLILLTLVLMIVAVTLEWLPMVTASALAVTFLLLTKSISGDEVIKSVNWQVLVVIAAALGVSKGVQNSGLAELASTFLMDISSSVGSFGVIFLVVLVAMIATEIVTNTAAAALLFPVIIALEPLSGLSIHTLSLALLFGATSSFATPIGYQTNLMVQGPGNYTFKDFLKVGVLIDIIVLFSASSLIYVITV